MELSPPWEAAICAATQKFQQQKKSHPCNRPFVTICNRILSLWWEVVSPTPNQSQTTTPCRLSATAYSLYLQLSSIFGGCFFHLEPKDVPHLMKLTISSRNENPNTRIQISKHWVMQKKARLFKQTYSYVWPSQESPKRCKFGVDKDITATAVQCIQHQPREFFVEGGGHPLAWVTMGCVAQCPWQLFLTAPTPSSRTILEQVSFEPSHELQTPSSFFHVWYLRDNESQQ
jgi:hypothetical protein